MQSQDATPRYGDFNADLIAQVETLGHRCEYDSGFYWVALSPQRLTEDEVREFIAYCHELEVIS
jgi:hypothetical protein